MAWAHALEAPAFRQGSSHGMRNILIHEYFGVDVTIVWHTAKKHLPVLRKQMENIIHLLN
jgi:uncharacterized protein with HEPN domain